MEGNNLTEINTILPSNFPQLTTLGISKNQFSCQYLVKFLKNWPKLHLIHNPSINQTHISGTDCIHEELIGVIDDMEPNFEPKSRVISKASFDANTKIVSPEHQSSFILEELRAEKSFCSIVDSFLWIILD